MQNTDVCKCKNVKPVYTEFNDWYEWDVCT